MTLDASLPTALGLGFVLGLRHALDADHIAAVSALVSQHRSVARSCLLGTFWGAGHTTALLVAGALTIAFRLTIAPEVERGLETLVAVLLVLLGAHVLLQSLGALGLRGHTHTGNTGMTHHHVHPGGRHTHSHADERIDWLRLATRPFAVGLLHGLAGSAALMLLALSTIPSPLGGFAYIALFGVGSTAGMLVISGLIGVPFALTGDRSREASVGIRLLAGLLSAGLGVALLTGLA